MTTAQKIYADLGTLYLERGPEFVFILCSVALKDLMGLENWKTFLSQSLNDPDFKHLFVETGYIPSQKKVGAGLLAPTRQMKSSEASDRPAINGGTNA